MARKKEDRSKPLMLVGYRFASHDCIRAGLDGSVVVDTVANMAPA